MMSFAWRLSTREVTPLAAAAAPLGAPGVLFGESVFETIRLRDGRVFRLDKHVERLQRSLHELGWGNHQTIPTMEEVQSGLQAILHRIPEDDWRVRLTALRLDDGRGLECFLQAVPYNPPSPEQYDRGVGAVVTDVRVEGAGTWTRYKLGNRFLFRRAQDQARRAEAWEGLLLNGGGRVADGAVSNVHFVRDSRIFAPSVDAGALPGVAQATVREIALELDFQWVWGDYAPEMFREADECFLTNALIGILPLTVLDGRPVGTGWPGPLTNRLVAAYEERRLRESRPPGGQK